MYNLNPIGDFLRDPAKSDSTLQTVLDNTITSFAQTKEEEEEHKLDTRSGTTFDVSELTSGMKREIELFRYVKNEPYFRHYLTNELRFYADRMNDHFATIYSGITGLGTRPNDYYQFDLPQIDKFKREIYQQTSNEPVLYNGKAFGSGKRKKARALAVIKEGNGKISINRKTFIEYFGTTSLRHLVLEPLMLSGYSIGMDVDIFIWGGGKHSQGSAASLALARALVKFNPGVKVSMRESKNFTLKYINMFFRWYAKR